jgi:hypothetical protein
MKIYIEAEVEADTMMSYPILANVLKAAIERTFFIDARVTKLIVRTDNDIPTTGIQTPTDV